MDYPALKTLIDSEPQNAERTDAEVLTWLQESVTVPRDVPWTEYMLWLSNVGGMRKLRVALADSGKSDAVRNACDLAILVAQAGQPLSLSRADVRTALGPLISGGVFTTQERDALLARSDTAVARHSTAGWTEVTLGNVERARSI